MVMNEEQLHKKLPIGQNEKIIKVIRHHWFAYVSIYLGAGLIGVIILAGIIFAIVSQSSLGLNDSAINIITIAGIALIVLIGLFSMIPAWIKKQEVLVLTEEALLQIEKPSIFANKTSQLNLQHIADVTVSQDTIGSMLGFGNLVIETPGEQNNYDFSMVASPREAAKAIIEAHENYAAALESGQIQTTLGQRQPMSGTAWRSEAPQWPVGDDKASQPLPPSEEVDPNKLKNY